MSTLVNYTLTRTTMARRYDGTTFRVHDFVLAWGSESASRDVKTFNPREK